MPAAAVVDSIAYGFPRETVSDGHADKMDESSEGLEHMGSEFARDREAVQQSIKDSASSEQDEELIRYVLQQIAAYRREAARERFQVDRGKANTAHGVSLGRKIGSWLGRAAEIALSPWSALAGTGKGASLGTSAGEALATLANQWAGGEMAAQHAQKTDMLGAKIMEKGHTLKQIEGERKKHLTEEAALEDSLIQKRESAVHLDRSRSEYRRAVQHLRAGDSHDPDNELDRRQSFARQITSRTGAAAAARIAAVAGDFQAGNPLVARFHTNDELARLHATVKSQHSEAKSSAAWRDLFTPKLRHES